MNTINQVRNCTISSIDDKETTYTGESINISVLVNGTLRPVQLNKDNTVTQFKQAITESLGIATPNDIDILVSYNDTEYDKGIQDEKPLKIGLPSNIDVGEINVQQVSNDPLVIFYQNALKRDYIVNLLNHSKAKALLVLLKTPSFWRIRFGDWLWVIKNIFLRPSNLFSIMRTFINSFYLKRKN